MSQGVHPLSASPRRGWPECSDVRVTEPERESPVPALLCLCQNSTARTTLLRPPRPWLLEHLGTSPAHLQGALLASAPFPGPGLMGCCTWGVGLREGPREAVWPLQGEAACFLPGTPGNSILRDLSLAFNSDIFQKLPGTNATPPRL